MYILKYFVKIYYILFITNCSILKCIFFISKFKFIIVVFFLQYCKVLVIRLELDMLYDLY